MNNILLEGDPGIGKTTLILKIAELLTKYRIGGFFTREIREHGYRVGFRIESFSGKSGILSHIKFSAGPQVGKYRVSMEELNSVGAKAIVDALVKCDVIIIDEIGPMELLSEKFKKATQKALNSPKPVLAVVHWKAKDRLIDETKNREDQETFTVTYQNRNKLPEAIARILAN